MIALWLLGLVGGSVGGLSCVSCPESWKGDGVCDLHCMLSTCNFDSTSFLSQSDCYQSCLSTGCSDLQLSNGLCESSCNSAVCGWDGGDCGVCAQSCKSPK